MYKQGAMQYRKVAATSGAVESNPHFLIKMLLQGALDRIATAKGCFDRRQLREARIATGKSLAIVQGLQAMLNHGLDNDIVNNLNRLYEYMARRLFLANAEKNTRHLEEVASLLKELKAGWDAIPRDYHQNNTPAAPH